MSHPPDSDAEYRRRLYETTTDPGLDLGTKQDRALALGRSYLGVQGGHIQRRRPDEDVDDVVASIGADTPLIPEGTRLDRSTTYCRKAVNSESTLALQNAPDEGWADDPAYEEQGFDCYIGTPIFVGGDVYGTVCFISEDPRSTEFTSDERAFVEMAARLLGCAIEMDRYQQQIAQQAQEQTRSRRKYESLLQVAPDAIFLADATTGDLIEANRKASELTGYGTAELRGCSVFQLLPDDYRDQYTDLFEGLGEETQRSQFEDGTPLYIARADDSLVPVEMSLSKVTLDGEELVQGIVRDISDRRERQRQLERREEFLKRTQEAADIGGWEVDLETDTVRWTDEVKRIHGVSLEYEPALEDALEFFHPDDRGVIVGAFERLADDGEPYDLDLRIVRPDESVRWVNALGHPVYDEQGEVVLARGVFRDITEQKERERHIRVQSRAIEESPIGITIGDANEPDIPIVYANEGFTDLTGYSKAATMGRNCRFLQGEGTKEDTVAAIRNAIAAEDPIQTEILNYRANGTPFWNKLTVSPITGTDSSEVTHFVGIQEDITAQKRRNRLIGVLDRVLRHNLRNAMTVVQGNCTVIADRTDGETARLATRVSEKATELIHLSEKVREFDKMIEQQKQLAERDVREDISVAVADIEAEYPDAEFHIETEECRPVKATDQLRLALRELCENAVKHGGGSRVTVTAGMTDDNRVEVQVHDDGDGLPEGERAVLETGQESPLNHGTGIGLWMVNWVVTGFGGEVTVTVDTGTTVTIRLPPATGDESGEHDRSGVSAALDGDLQ